MVRKMDDVANDALALPAEERVRLVSLLWESLDSPEQVEIDKAWAEEAEERIRAHESGEIKSVLAEEAIEQVRQKLRQGRGR